MVKWPLTVTPPPSRRHFGGGQQLHAIDAPTAFGLDHGIAEVKDAALRIDHLHALNDQAGKRLQINEKVSANVFNRMKTARNRQTEATITRGQAEATKIVTDAASIRKELLAAANGRAMAIRGQGDAEAAQFYKMLDAEPKFAIFLKNLEALKVILQQRTTMVLPMDAAPFNLLLKSPDPNALSK